MSYLKTKMSLQTVFECPCRQGFRYSSKASFNQHKKSQRHVFFTKNDDDKTLRKRLQDLEIELSMKKKECQVWKQKFLELSLKYESESQIF
jgi:hypothetical protein